MLLSGRWGECQLTLGHGNQQTIASASGHPSNPSWPSANEFVINRPCPKERAPYSLPEHTRFESEEPGVKAVKVGVGIKLPGDPEVVFTSLSTSRERPSEAPTQ